MNKYLRAAITAALLAWVAWQTDWDAAGRAFSTLRIELWLAAVGVLVLTQLVSAWRWQMLARPFGFERSVGQLASYYFVGMYFNLLLPTSVGGDVVRAWYLDGGSQRRLAAFVAVLLDRISGLLMLLSLACVGVLLTPLALPAWIPVFVWGTTLAALVTLALAPWLARRGERFSRQFGKVYTALVALCSPRLFAVSTLLSLAVQAGNVILVWLVGLAIHVDVPFGYYWIMVPMVSLLTMLPVSINGMGVREGAMVLFLAPLAVPEGTAATLALLWFAVVLFTSLGGGLVYLFGQYQRPTAVRPAALERTEAEHESVCGSADQGRARQYRAAA